MRLTVVAVLLAVVCVAALAGAAPVAFPDMRLALLAGPQVEPGDSTYDQDYRAVADAKLTEWKSWSDHSQWDLAIAWYGEYFRTSDPKYRDAARRYVESLQSGPYWRLDMIARNQVGDFSTDVSFNLLPTYANLNALGIAVYALECSSCPAAPWAREILGAYAGYYAPVVWDPNTWWGPRDTASVASWALGKLLIGDGEAVVSTGVGPQKISAILARAVDQILAHQEANGAWCELGPNYGAEGACTNFMQGFMSEILVLVDRAVGDPRIVPALVRGYEFLDTQYAAPEKAYRYNDRNLPGFGDPYPEPRLNGLFVMGLAYLGQRTGDPKYAGRVQDLLAGLSAATGTTGALSLKEFAQNFRASGQAVALLSGAPIARR
jgi:hypothetical protein